MTLTGGPEFEVAHLEKGRQEEFLLWEVFKQEAGCTGEILVGSGLAQMTSEGSPTPEMHCTVLGMEADGGEGLAGQNLGADRHGWVNEGLD